MNIKEDFWLKDPSIIGVTIDTNKVTAGTITDNPNAITSNIQFGTANQLHDLVHRVNPFGPVIGPGMLGPLPVQNPATVALTPEIQKQIADMYKKVPDSTKHSHYFKDVSKLKMIDVYRVLELFGVTDQALGHAIKKLLVAGGRGAGKSIEKDIQEAVDTLQRRLEMHKELNA